jgi:hypothetical protein
VSHVIGATRAYTLSSLDPALLDERLLPPRELYGEGELHEDEPPPGDRR